jgi:hypothetical protein
MSNELLFQQQQQQQQVNANSQLEINQVQVGGQELGEEGKEEEKEELVIETLQELDHEIECPKCNDVMVLSADFDSLCYLCEQCKFSLSL